MNVTGQRVHSWISPAALGAAVLTLAGAGAATASKGGDDMPPTKQAAAVATIKQDVRIDQPVVAVRLPVARAGASAERLRQARTELVLDDIAVARPPRVQFNVYLSSLSSGGPQPRREYVGTLSFYGVNPRTGSSQVPRRTFDVTQELRALLGNSAALPDLQVVFEATDGTAGSKPAEAGALLDRDSGLRVGSIELRVAEKP